ncbi:hypothetical protein FFK22_035340 [Mycobacterium sp. KBS0706]|uniref:hypothetical protein n=1 Tax=Mycobacterium sp. KBS0706 TaxID=2578109 RepID=UPI00110FB678|nr:hypothetical protein [Mycobacterium sp. KBS0706]TSD83922.1 hypothetical protein FFK22_035340 [Mycobacterium sp. KBS0706]
MASRPRIANAKRAYIIFTSDAVVFAASLSALPWAEEAWSDGAPAADSRRTRYNTAIKIHILIIYTDLLDITSAA